MENSHKNTLINDKLKAIYNEYTAKFLELWNNCFEASSQKAPTGIHEFGIIDPEQYDKENGILFIAKETRGWDFSPLPWLHEMAMTRIAGTNRPRMWYNIGRWAKLIHNSKYDKKVLLSEKDAALSGLSYIAFTNINKIGGYSSSGKSYNKLLKSNLPYEVLSKEIDVIKPRVIVLCGVEKNIIKDANDEIKVIEMPHPSARNISNEAMLERLEHTLTGS